jgi:hypothetical protein
MIKLSDRVKELSYTVGTGNMFLNGAAVGFSSFGSIYSYDDYLFYAITDGTSYEIGSGQYILDGTNNALKRFPFRSSNNNQIINFGQGLKEIYVTYPATHSVYIGSGVNNFSTPQNSGVAFWGDSNTLDYDSGLVWDKNNNRLGINNNNPSYAIDIAGYGPDSIIRSSGVIVGSSGVYFPPANNEDIDYIGGRQLIHFEKNALGDPNIESIIRLSGTVDNVFLLKEQNAGLVFAGPPSGCSPPCSPALPSFRPLLLMDIEEAVIMSGIFRQDITTVSGIVDDVSGILRQDLIIVSGILDGVSGILRNDLTVVSGIAQYDNQIRVTPSGLSFRLNTSNRNIDPLPNVGSLIIQPVDDNTVKQLGTSCGVVSQITNFQQVNSNHNTCSIFSNNSPHISGNAINSGEAYGILVNSYRNSPIAVVDNNIIIFDGGDLKSQYGLVVNYGNWPSGYLSPTTETSVGISVGCLIGSGTIVSGIDLLLQNNDISNHAPNTSFPQDHFGIYQGSQNPNYKNYFVGKTGFNTSSPAYTLDVNGSGNFKNGLFVDNVNVLSFVDNLSGVLYVDFVNLSGILRSDLTTVSGIVDGVSGILRADLTTVSGIVDGVSGILRADLTAASGIVDGVSGILRADLTTVSGIVDGVSGILRADLTTVSGIAQYDNQIRVTPSGLSFRNNTANSNLDPIPNIGSYISQSVRDNSIKTFGVSCGAVVQMQSIQESSYADNTASIFFVNNMNVSGDFVNSGVAYGAIINSFRNAPIAITDGFPLVIDGGTLKEKYCIAANYGNWPSGYLSPKTDLAAGIAIGLLVGSGVIQSGIDILMSNNPLSEHAPNTSFPNSHFGIYQGSENPDYKNCFVGKTGFKTTNPSHTIDIADNTIRLRNNRTISNSGDPGETGEICWDSDHIYVCIAPSSWKRTSLSTWS